MGDFLSERLVQACRGSNAPTHTEWPKRPDGTNKTVGEMTPEERRCVFKASAERIKRELESPEMAAAFRKNMQRN